MQERTEHSNLQLFKAKTALLGRDYDWLYRKSFSLEDLKIMDGLERLIANSQRLRRVFMALLLLLPVLNAMFWVLVGMGNKVAMQNLPVTMDPGIPAYSLVLCFWVSMIPTSVLMFAFYQLIKLVGFYSQGIFFARQNVTAIRTLGKAIIAWEVANFFSSMVLGSLLTLHRGPAQHLLMVGLDDTDFYALVAGFSVLTIAWVMNEARKLKEEQELIV